MYNKLKYSVTTHCIENVYHTKVKISTSNTYCINNMLNTMFGVFCWWTKSFICILTSNINIKMLYVFIEFITVHQKLYKCGVGLVCWRGFVMESPDLIAVESSLVWGMLSICWWIGCWDWLGGGMPLVELIFPCHLIYNPLCTIEIALFGAPVKKRSYVPLYVSYSKKGGFLLRIRPN